MVDILLNIKFHVFSILAGPQWNRTYAEVPFHQLTFTNLL